MEHWTKWTYELSDPPGSTSFVTNEIVDTVTIDGFKLYEVASEPVFTGIKYFHFLDSRVYNYDPQSQILQLLYDFDQTSNYQTEYRPICDPEFIDSLSSQSYVIQIDSISTFQLPNGEMTTIQYTNNEVTRKVLKNIGFMEGYIHHTHDWEFGVYICDEWANFVGKLRCFENDSVSYNFQQYACDSTWITTSIKEVNKLEVKVYPNPTLNNIKVDNVEEGTLYKIYNDKGNLLMEGTITNNTIGLGQFIGILILKIKIEDNWITKKIVKLE